MAELSTVGLAPDEHQSPVSWDAIWAGAAASVALLFVLLSLAAGFGLKMTPRWPSGVATRDFTPVLGAIFIACQVVASMLGGYLTGRLRTKWLHIHDHETYFRDTAHGLLAWAVSVVGLLVLGALATSAPTTTTVELTPAEAMRAAQMGAQVSLFLGVGALTSAFSASVAATIGGMRRDEMHKLHRAA